jgi:hypothetical protein
MPSASNCLNSAWAALNFSGSRRRNLEATGGPEVRIKCTTPCDVSGRRLDAFTTLGKRSNSSATDEAGVPGGEAKDGVEADGGEAKPGGEANEGVEDRPGGDPEEGVEASPGGEAGEAAKAATVGKTRCVSETNSLFSAGSTKRWWCRRKSTPMMGN